MTELDADDLKLLASPWNLSTDEARRRAGRLVRRGLLERCQDDCCRTAAGRQALEMGAATITR